MITIKIATTKDELKSVFAVRRAVFIDEQNVPENLEIDDLEDFCIHFLVKEDDLAIGAGRFRDFSGVAKIERICLLKEHRKRQIGMLLMAAIEEEARKRGFKKAKLASQVQAISFYEKLGFSVCSDEFLDAGILHKTMMKDL